MTAMGVDVGVAAAGGVACGAAALVTPSASPPLRRGRLLHRRSSGRIGFAARSGGRPDALRRATRRMRRAATRSLRGAA